MAQNNELTKPRDHWSGRAGFVMATIGSAIGIGSIWKFPYEVGANGGMAFLLFYFVGIALIVVPLLLAEFAIGRQGGGDAATSIASVAAAHSAGRGWGLAGVLGIVTGFMVLSFYAVIGGWTIGYAVNTALEGLPGLSSDDARARYAAFLSSPLELSGWHALFLGLTTLSVCGGITRGIEVAVKILMPVLVVLVTSLAIWSVAQGDVAATLRFFFRLDPLYLTPSVALDALGLGFFSISVGFGMMITYAAYARPEIRLTEVAIVSVAADCAISILAGFAIFPVVFAHGLDPAQGAGLVFVTLPLAFAAMPFGEVAAVAFFLLMFVAALASAISMLELAVAPLLSRLDWPRPVVAVSVAAACFVLGLGTVLSFNRWADWHPLSGLEGFTEATFFDVIDHATSNILLPAAGLSLALFVGWAVPVGRVVDALELPARAARLLCALLRYVVPLGILGVMLAPLFG